MERGEKKRNKKSRKKRTQWTKAFNFAICKQ